MYNLVICGINGLIFVGLTSYANYCLY